MLRQYNPQRFRTLPNGVRVGTINVGDILYIQDGIRPLSPMPQRVVCREPWQVIAWVPREAPHTNRHGVTEMRRCAGGHIALVRSLRNSRVKPVADWILQRCADEGLEKQ